ncbi:MAG: helix-turn-helix domain containing protein [Selenomonadaceae bacterium]|nr:helix-turn-helix domain containing protein [Selenomonadaceae bacterium]
MRTRKAPEERKQEIFAVAEQLFIERGYAVTTVADIARAAGVAKSTFFYYFATKDDLLADIGRHWAQEFAARYRKLEQGKDAVAHLRTFMRIFEGDDPLDQLFDQLIAEHQYRLMETIWQAMREETMDPLLTGILQQGVQEGSMHLAGDMASVVHFFWCLYDAIYPTEEQSAQYDEAQMQRYLALGHGLMEQMLGLPQGTLQEHVTEA